MTLLFLALVIALVVPCVGAALVGAFCWSERRMRFKVATVVLALSTTAISTVGAVSAFRVAEAGLVDRIEARYGITVDQAGPFEEVAVWRIDGSRRLCLLTGSLADPVLSCGKGAPTELPPLNSENS